MNKRDEFLKSQKVLRLATIGKNKSPHIVPVWYMYSSKKIYIGTHTRTQKAKNVKKNNKVSFLVDAGINSPNIYGVKGEGNANLILDIHIFCNHLIFLNLLLLDFFLMHSQFGLYTLKMNHQDF